MEKRRQTNIFKTGKIGDNLKAMYTNAEKRKRTKHNYDY